MFTNKFVIAAVFSILVIIITYITFDKEDSEIWNSIKNGILSFIFILISLYFYNYNMVKEVIKTSPPPF